MKNDPTEWKKFETFESPADKMKIRQNRASIRIDTRRSKFKNLTFQNFVLP